MRNLPPTKKRYHDEAVIAERNKKSDSARSKNWLWAHATSTPTDPYTVLYTEFCLEVGEAFTWPDGSKAVWLHFYPDTILFDGTECFRWPELAGMRLEMPWGEFLQVCRRRKKLSAEGDLRGAKLAKILWPKMTGSHGGVTSNVASNVATDVDGAPHG